LLPHRFGRRARGPDRLADKRDPKDPYDKRIDLAAEVRRDLDDANRDYLDVVCFTHLDTDHVKGSREFFWFEHAACYQVPGRIKIRELWVPAAAVTEEGADDDARVIRQEARYRLKQGKGIKVFSRPERLHDLLESWGLTVADRASCIVDAGQTVPGFYKEGPDKAEFFVHSPFAWRLNDREVEDHNQDSIVMTPVGGSHGNPHPAARIHCHGWQRGGRVVARGTRAAA
jgi:hypothetical protein